MLEDVLDLEEAFDGLAVGADEEHLVGFRESRRCQGIWEDFAVIDTTSGKSQPLHLPFDAEVFDLVSVRDQPAIIAELWVGGRERLDGTELTEFYLWDYSQGEATRLFKNYKFFQLHELPANVQPWPADCVQAKATTGSL